VVAAQSTNDTHIVNDGHRLNAGFR
jgi:hypothetical protein